jgi:vacuolar-type H+-ATPase subunit H
MREVVERVLGAEEEARGIIEKAREKAAAIRLQADQAASAVLAAAREKVVRDSRERLEAARAAAADLMEQARRESAASAGAAEADAESVVSALVDDIVAMITGQTASEQSTAGQAMTEQAQ